MKIDFSQPLVQKNGEPFFKVAEGQKIPYTLGLLVSDACSFLDDQDRGLSLSERYQFGKWAHELEAAGVTEMSLDDVKKIKDRILAKVMNMRLSAMVVDLLDPKAK